MQRYLSQRKYQESKVDKGSTTEGNTIINVKIGPNVPVVLTKIL